MKYKLKQSTIVTIFFRMRYIKLIMVIGYFLTRWDENVGNVIDAKTPNNFEISDEELVFFLSTMNYAVKQPLFLIQEEQRVFIIHGISSNPNEPRLKNAIYDFLGIILTKEDINFTSKYQVMISIFAQEIEKQKYDNRIPFFHSYILEKKRQSFQKIVFVGHPNAGKTSTQKLLFQKMNSVKILNETNIPTIGIEISHHKLFDLNISLFDTSGQELEFWLNDESDVFQNAELIIFFFSINDWQADSPQVKANLIKFSKIIHSNSTQNIDALVFCHKIDILSEKELIKLKDEINPFVESLHLPIFFTSLKNGGNQDLILGIQRILTKYSDTYKMIEIIFQSSLQNTKIFPLFLIEDHIYIRFLMNKSNILTQPLIDQIQNYIFDINLSQYKNFGTEMEFHLFQSSPESPYFALISFSKLPQLRGKKLMVLGEQYEEIVEFIQRFRFTLKSFEWKNSK